MLQGPHFLILGLGSSGLAMARWCARQGARVTVADSRAQPPQLSALQQDVPGAVFVHGPLEASLLQPGAVDAVHAVYRSPGLAPHEISALTQVAQSQGIAVGGELTLFMQALADLKASHQYAPKVLAVTGTNGKTTVTALTRHLIAWAGKTVEMAGNIGPTLLDTLSQALDSDALPEVWVLELSSFQLDAAPALEPCAATVLNVTQDHLDWHGSMAHYAQAKAHIFGQHGLMVLNREDPLVMAMLGTAESAPVRAKQRPQQRAFVSFGGDVPQRPGDFGLEELNGMVWLVRALEADEARQPRKGQVEVLHIQRLMPADALRIRGRHNAVNALAALALCSAAGCALAPILFGLREYRGEPHRVEPIGLLHGVEYFDDSKGTNVGATVAALRGLGAERKLVVILGGDGKGQDFAPLAEPVARHARSVVLIGRDAGLLRAALQASGVPLRDAPTLEQAVALAAQCALAGDAVLLSPACASLDMFDNYVHRAAVFRAALGSLALEAGQELEHLP